MSYNGSGTFVINTAGQPVVSGTVISSTAFNALTADLATGLSTAITKDGQTTPTANIPMGNNKITGLAVGTAATDAANLSQVQSTAAKLVNSVSGADTITGTMSPNLGAYATGQMFYFVAVGANTGAVTINIDSLGAKSITRDGTTALAAGDIQSGEVCVIVYDGTQFQLVNGASQSASIVTENLTVNKATVLNESGGDNDTRIEGDTDANLFFADASTDRVGIGTSSPSNKLTVSGNADVTGNLGIGTASPGYKLDILGAGRAYQDASAGAAPLIAANFNTGSNTTKAVSVLFQGKDTASTLKEVGQLWAYPVDANWVNAGLQFWTRSGDSLSERMRLDNAGNLGLGVTPSAWATVTPALEMRNGVHFATLDTSTPIAYLGANSFYNGSNWIYKTSSQTAARYEINAGGNGSHAWFTAPSGTAGNAISFTQAMTLDASGNLLVGTTSAGYSAAGRGLIEINGSSNALLALRTGGTNRGYLYTQGTDMIAWAETGAFTVGTAAAAQVAFSTNNTERARITSGGNFQLTSGGQIELNVSTLSSKGAIAAFNVDSTSGGLVFKTESSSTLTERARITADGNFYVNTTAAGGKVYVVSDLTANNGLRVDTPASFTSNMVSLVCGTAAGTGWYFLSGESSGGSTRIQIRGDGNVYNANGTYGTISDARLKQDIVDAGSQWDTIKAVRFRKYRMKADVEENPDAPALFGVVAQELEQVCPGLVDDGEIKTVKSSILLMKAAKALQEAMARIEQLEAKVAALEAK
jgi:hypothetical protein